jgi:hypothetical protein
MKDTIELPSLWEYLSNSICKSIFLVNKDNFWHYLISFSKLSKKFYSLNIVASCFSYKEDVSNIECSI